MAKESKGPSLTAPTSTLTLREKLLFAQAVHKVGAGPTKWAQVRELLDNCPVVVRPEGYWSDQACQAIYEALMQETEFDKILKSEEQPLPHAGPHLFLAQHFYELRMEEIRAEIEEKDERFRALATEINAIKSGEAIYNPAVMLRLRDILLENKRSASKEDIVETEQDHASLVEVEIKIGDGEKTGKEGMALFKRQDCVVWKMTRENLRLAADGRLPPSQKKPRVDKEDAPIQAQAPSRRVTSEVPESEKAEDIKEDAPLQAQGPPPSLTRSNESKPASTSKRPAGVKAIPEVPPQPVISTSVDDEIVPDSQEETDGGKEDEEDGQSTMIGGESKNLDVMEVDNETVPSSTAGDSHRLLLETTQPSQNISEQSSEDDLTPPPMSPNLIPTQLSTSTLKNNTRTAAQTGFDEDVAIINPTKRRRTRPVTPVKQGTTTIGEESGDELSPVPATPTAKKTDKDEIDEDNEEEADGAEDGEDEEEDDAGDRESESEPEVTRPATTRRGRGMARKGDPDIAKNAEEEEPETGARRTRRQEVNKRASTRHVRSSPDPPSIATKRSSRPSVERSIRKRPGRSKAGKENKDELDTADQDSVTEEARAEEAATTRRSTRQAKTMPDLKEEDDEEENIAEGVASPATTIDEDKRKRPAETKRQRNRDGTNAKQTNKEEPVRKDPQRREDKQNDADELDSEKEGENEPARGPQQKIDEESDKQAREAESIHDDPTPTESKALRKTRSATNATNTDMTSRQFKSKMNQLHQEILGHKHGPVFNAAVRASDAPGYYEIIKKPMDLKKIKANIKNGIVKNIDDFQRDLLLMFCNAMMYNKPNSEVYRMAEEMMGWCEEKISDFKNAEALASSRSR